MTPAEGIARFGNFLAAWAGTTVPRLLMLFGGLLLVLWAGVRCWEKKMRWLPAAFCFLVGGLLVAFAVDVHLLRMLLQTDLLLRIRILMGFISGSVLIVTFEAIRRSRLQERYALLWVVTGLIILLGAFFPDVLDYFRTVFGMQYITSVVTVVFTFLLLVVFHFSIAMSAFESKQAQVAQRCAILEARVEELEKAVRSIRPDLVMQPAAGIPVVPGVAVRPQAVADEATVLRRGTRLGAPILIAASAVAMLCVGLAAREPMLGDEVTHYFMMVEQAKKLPEPNFQAPIPMSWGDTEMRRYPHVMGWHYLGALFYRVSGAFALTQGYQLLYWIQFLVVAYVLAKSRGGNTTRASLLYVVTLASLPAAVIFGIAFYQDIPVAAQVLTAFYLLSRAHWIGAVFFMAFALCIKETAFVFLPSFALLMALWAWRRTARVPTALWRRTGPVVGQWAVLGLVAGLTMWVMARSLEVYAGAGFYPVDALRKTWQAWTARVPSAMVSTTADEGRAEPALVGQPVPLLVTPYEAEIIANHPGDLRLPVNYVVYGGVLLWMVVVGGFVGLWRMARRDGVGCVCRSGAWPIFVAVAYVLPTAYVLRTAPDARFFLPAVPFLLLPFCEWAAAGLPRAKSLILVLTALAMMQVAFVFRKTLQLRSVSEGLDATIRYLAENPPLPRRVFMYPEGSYRLFPVPHDWYLAYRLRDLWQGDADTRIAILRQFGIGAVVVKKHLIAEPDPGFKNLGIYPTHFVDFLNHDPRVSRVMDNDYATVYSIRPPVPVQLPD